MKLAASLLAALVCAAVPALAVPVSVTVVGPDKKPLPGAKLSSFEVKFTTDKPDGMREQTGVNGVFSWNWDGDFDDKRPFGERKLLSVRASAPGLAPQNQLIRQGQTTISLQTMRIWSGVVLDRNQRPVEGVTMKLGQVKAPAPDNADALGASATVEVPAQTVVTDEQGRWKFIGLPQRGTAEITFADSRFALQRLTLPVGEGDAAPITVRPGGTIKGQLLLSDGSPIVGEKVKAGYNVENETVTDAQGRFVLNSVQSGNIALYVGDFFGNKPEKLPPYLLERVRFVEVESEKTTNVGPIKAQKGLLLQARVVGADTKKPLPEARFRIGYNIIVNVTDADGTLQSRVVPTEELGGFDRAKIESEGYVDYELPLAALKTTEQSVDLGTIEMKRGNVIAGTIRIEGADAKVDPPGISFSRDGKYDFVNPDKDGGFASKTLEAGSYSVNLNGNNGNWQIVSPRNVTVPEFGVEAKPVEVVVKRLTPILPVIKSARGRVLDENGQGVAGVSIRANMGIEGGGSYSNRTATTDKDGAFTLNGRDGVVSVEINAAEHPAYLVGGKAEVEVNDGIATITGLSARKRGAVFAGRVVGADGKAAAGAWVAVVEARDYEPVRADENGAFSLVDVPLAQFTLLAASGRDWVKQAAQSDKTGVTLKLQTSEVVVDRAQALDQMMTIESGISTDKLFAAWNVLGAEGIERYLRRNGEPRAEIMAQFGAEMARRDPAQLLKRGPELLGASKGETRENLEAQLNLVRAQSDDADARIDANAWLDEQKQVKREIKPRSVTQLLQMAAVAGKLERDDAAQWLDYAAALNAQLKGDGESNAYQWSNALAGLGYDAIATFAEGSKVPAEFQLWSYTTPVMAKAGDVAGAQKGLARMETLLEDPAMTEAAEQASKNRRVQPARSLETVQSAVAGALAPSDPVAAFALAQKVENIFTRAGAMIRVGDGAQKAGNAEIAARALRDVKNPRNGNVELFAQAAVVGARVSPQLGDELFAFAKEQASPKGERSRYLSPSIGAWAFYHAPIDAAQSRVLIEREWDWRLPAAIKAKNEPYSSEFNALYELVHGMVAVDTKRAAEMQTQVDAIGIKNYGKAMSQFDIAVATLATAAQRERLGVNEIN